MPITIPYSYRPKFTPGPEPCTIQIFSESRSRKLISAEGATFYVRSKGFSYPQNSISIQSSSVVTVDGSPVYMSYKVTVTVISGAIVETYEGNQDFFPADPATPWIDASWDGAGAVNTIRSLVNSNSQLIEMPTVGIDVNYTSGNEDHVPNFPQTNLSGAVGGPIDVETASPTIRTGPLKSIIQIGQGEASNTGGYSTMVFAEILLDNTTTGFAAASNYTITITVQGTPHNLSILGSNALTIAALLTELNAQLLNIAVVTKKDKNITITSLSTGPSSTCTISNDLLFTAIPIYSAVGPTASGSFNNGAMSTLNALREWDGTKWIPSI